MRAAAVQMTTGADPARNVARAGELVRDAAARGADLVVLPEKWHFIHDAERTREGAEPLDGPAVTAAREWARELGIVLVAGSVSERVEGDLRAFNTSLLIGRDGSVLAAYRKLHLFDVEVGGTSYRESAGALAGDRVVAAGAGGVRVGLSVCYDLRFPELYRALALDGAQVLTVPAAFTAATGKDHWEPLLRARAIENQCFVVAAGQVGVHANGTRSHGRSMIVDPWGIVLAQAPDAECVVVADLDLARMAHVRETLPALRHRRPDVYGAPGAGAGGDGPQGT